MYRRERVLCDTRVEVMSADAGASAIFVRCFLTSLASVVALPDLLRMARVAQGVHFNPSPLILAALLYLALLWPLVRLIRRLGGRAVLPA